MGKKITVGNRVLIAFAALFLATGCFSLTIFPASRFSESENRMLVELPAFTVKEFASGNYASSLDVYAAERLPFRIPLRHGRSLLQLALGKHETGGVILCRDGSLARRIEVNNRVWHQNLTALQALEKQGYTVAIAPRRIDARAEVLPLTYNAEDDRAPWGELKSALPNSLLLNTLTEDAQWYRTDHHWSTAGAYEAYCLLGDALGYTPTPESGFQRKTVSTAFYGTSASAASLPFLPPDCIELWHYDGEEALTVHYDGTIGVLYDLSKLDTRDGYAVFQGGNHARTEITKGDRPTLLVIKDSFANSLLPFLAQHFNVLAIDPRYGNADLSTLRFDRALVLCGMQTLCQTTFLKI